MDEVVARHVLETRVFEDAVSEIWHARHADRATQRAIIRVVDLSRDPHLAPAVTAFLADARKASDLVHRNIARAYDIGDDTQPYVLGRDTQVVTWSAHLRDGIGAAAAIGLLTPLAAALDAAADAGIPHGAVHPRSIWIDDVGARPGGGRALLTGFGLHHLLSVVAARASECRSVDDFLYVAPELLRGAAPTNRSDQYSLAAALQHALTGRPPFVREHLSGLFGAHLFGHRASLDGEASDPRSVAELDHILDRAMAKDPSDRFASCQDLMDAVASWHAGTTGVATPDRHVAHSKPTPLPLRSDARLARNAERRRTRALAITGTVVAVGLLGVLWLARGPTTPRAELAGAAGEVAPQLASSEVAPADLAVRWRQRLDSGVSELQMTTEGPLAVTTDGAVLLDSATGDKRADLSDGDAVGAVAAGDRVVSVDGTDLRAVSAADGSMLWTAETPTGTPTVTGDTVYGVTDGDVPQLVATDADSGDRLWEFPRSETAFPADSAVAARKDFVYLADGTAIYGILPKGEMAGEDTPLITASEAASEPLCLWREEVDEDMWASSLQAVEQGVVIANRSGTVCLRRHHDGATLWCVPVAGVARAEPTIHPTDGRVIVASHVGITAIDTETGEHLWTRTGGWQRTVVANDQLIAVDGDGRIAALSLATGTLTRPVETTVGVPSALAVDGDTLYVGRRDGAVISVALTTPRS